ASLKSRSGDRDRRSADFRSLEGRGAGRQRARRGSERVVVNPFERGGVERLPAGREGDGADLLRGSVESVVERAPGRAAVLGFEDALAEDERARQDLRRGEDVVRIGRIHGQTSDEVSRKVGRKGSPGISSVGRTVDALIAGGRVETRGVRGRRR